MTEIERELLKAVAEALIEPRPMPELQAVVRFWLDEVRKESK